MSNHALAALLAHPAIWRGDDCAPEPAALPSGFAALDAALPGRGWPQGALTEILLEREGIGELRLTLPALARVQAQGRDVVWIAPPHRALRARARGGGARSRALLRRALPRRRRTRCGPTSRRCARPNAAPRSRGSARTTSACCAACRWPRAKAARGACCGGVPGSAAAPRRRRCGSASPPRTEGRLAVRVLKRRGAELAQPVMIDVARLPAPVAAGFSRPLAAPRRARAGHALTRGFHVPRPLAITSPRWPYNNAWANHRLLAACGTLSQAEFVATRDELLPLAQGDAQPHRHRRLVLRRRARARACAASAPNHEAVALLRPGRAVRHLRGARGGAARSRPAARRRVHGAHRRRARAAGARHAPRGRRRRNAPRACSRICSSTRSTIAGRRTRCSRARASSRRSSTSSSARTRRICAPRSWPSSARPKR